MSLSKDAPPGQSERPAEGGGPNIRVTSLYQFTRLDDCAGIRSTLQSACGRLGIRGTLILAPEGINGTIAGSHDAVEAIIGLIRSLPGCKLMAVKDSHTAEKPFHRMKVKIKPEIVTMGEPDISPLNGVGQYVPPEEWNALILDPEVVVIDTRNDYEVEIGSFRNAIDPGTKSFRDFPSWFRDRRSSLAAKPKVAMFCTGGIRCEKATALLKAEGIEEVYHLEGGILKYLEVVPEEESLWQGECFVFDQRVSLTHGLAQGSFDICHACRMPVSAEEKISDQYEEGVSCPSCFDSRDAERRQGYAERHRQVKLADSRGAQHIGPQQPAAPADLA
ncbi:MAG: rhodanese-related sulfurtransferase [Sphingosinicella sp.]|nr:rhodanese-related sulfurtransferase [Sphingosinicella sp.]